MSIFFVSLITSRPLSQALNHNLVTLGESEQILSGHQRLMPAADLIQSRFPYGHFLLEASVGCTEQQIQSLPGSYEVALQSGVYGLPFEGRINLPEADITMVNFHTYSWLFHAVHNSAVVDIESVVDIEPAVVDVDAVWEDCYLQNGLLCFRQLLEGV